MPKYKAAIQGEVHITVEAEDRKEALDKVNEQMSKLGLIAPRIRVLMDEKTIASMKGIA